MQKMEKILYFYFPFCKQFAKEALKTEKNRADPIWNAVTITNYSTTAVTIVTPPLPIRSQMSGLV